MSQVSDVIKHDHRELEEYHEHIVNSPSEDDQTRYQNLFTWELARHSLGEEIVVYPAMEEHLPNGKEIADKDREQHQELKELLYKFQQLKAGSSDFLPTLEALWAPLSQHIKEEEKDDLPALEKALETQASADLARSFERTKMFVPTQSHPSAPDKPPFETVVGLMTAPIDKLTDLFKKFPKD